METKTGYSKKIERRKKIFKWTFFGLLAAGVGYVGYEAYRTQTTAEKLTFDVKEIKLVSANLDKIIIELTPEIINPTNDTIFLSIPQITLETEKGEILMTEFPTLASPKMKKIEILKNSKTIFPKMQFTFDTQKLGLFVFNQVNEMNAGNNQGVKLKVIAKGKANWFPYTKEKVFTI